MSGKRAIIDIGSNTVRLVVYEGPPRAPEVVLNEKVTAKLGREVARSGLLADKAMDLALTGLARFATMLRLMDVRDVDTVATAAVRDAANGADFVAQVRNLGLEPRVLSGEDEARISALGVIAAFHGADGTTADLGGGSLELMHVDDGRCGTGVTLPLGTLRLPALRADGEARFTGRIRKMLGDSGWSAGKDKPFYLVGGSFRAFALYAMHKLDWPLDDPHGLEIAPDDAVRVCKAITQGKLETVRRISSSRVATLPDAAALLEALVAEVQPSKLVFSSWGLREGLLYSKLDAATQAQNPIIAGVAAFAEGLGVTSAEAAMVAGWTAEAATRARGDDQLETLRLAANMLALAAMRTEPNLRADQAMGWALRKRWIGLDARGRAVIAMAVLANGGALDVPPVFASLASEEDLAEAIGWGLAIRLCRRLTGTTAPAMAGSRLTRRDDRLVLSIAGPLHALASYGTSKDLRQLADWIGLECEIAMEPADAPV